ncbi:ankyrin repeat-containing domain protein [Clohesyomyces aquaticus]|uniref:Ankyrin repeat-containing domain protein n=1 Tax=Clohesyomyces aquaticus TaxID=1231657 RepID=A0A1Y2A9B3_9PLEO|nr:ankyrin repeat-containing domain protein [Clohesyomyces aquaticus]
MSTPLPYTTTSATVTPMRPGRHKRCLNYLKCYFCRKDKQKCTPTERQWPEQKCHRCLEKSLACSAPLRANGHRHQVGVLHMPRHGECDVPVVDWPREPTFSEPFETPLGLHSDAEFRRPLLLAILRTILQMAVDELKELSYDMGKPFRYDPCHLRYTRHLDQLCSEYTRFIQVLQREISQTFSLPPIVLDVVMAGHTISKNVSGIPDPAQLEEELQEIDKHLETGNSELAYMLQLRRLHAYPKQIDKELSRLEGCQTQYLASCKEILESESLKGYVPSALVSPVFLPSPLLRNQNFKWFADRTLHGAITLDCLGRTFSHMLADAGLDPYWSKEDFKHRDALGRTGIYFDCRRGKPISLNNLFGLGEVLQQQTVAGLPPLCVAASMGYTSLCRQIWDHTASTRDEGSRDKYKRTALAWAVLCGNGSARQATFDFFCDRMRLVAEAAADVGNDPAGLAAVLGYIEIIKSLLARKLPIDTPDKAGRTPFWYAAQGSHLPILEFLADYVDTDHRDKEGRSPLAEAARKGSSEAVRFLLGLNRYDSGGSATKLKVDPNSRDNGGNIPLILAASGGHSSCVKLLARYPVIGDLDQKDLRAAQVAANGRLDWEALKMLGLPCAAMPTRKYASLFHRPVNWEGIFP